VDVEAEVKYIIIIIYIMSEPSLPSNYFWLKNGGLLLNFRPPRQQVLFNWAAFYKPNSLPSSTVGASSAPGLIGARKRRT
jgi:hypothetical protein